MSFDDAMAGALHFEDARQPSNAALLMQGALAGSRIRQ